mmetsp:Transcript_89318/g.251431  ORF Transcript_89318/g.251431 Transcript_89318/m.251431 type:complete len:431 (-) Transcript_89318:328-1620(-)
MEAAHGLMHPSSVAQPHVGKAGGGRAVLRLHRILWNALLADLPEGNGSKAAKGREDKFQALFRPRGGETTKHEASLNLADEGLVHLGKLRGNACFAVLDLRLVIAADDKVELWRAGLRRLLLLLLLTVGAADGEFQHTSTLTDHLQLRAALSAKAPHHIEAIRTMRALQQPLGLRPNQLRGAVRTRFGRSGDRVPGDLMAAKARVGLAVCHESVVFQQEDFFDFAESSEPRARGLLSARLLRERAAKDFAIVEFGQDLWSGWYGQLVDVESKICDRPWWLGRLLHRTTQSHTHERQPVKTGEGALCGIILLEVDVCRLLPCLELLHSDLVHGAIGRREHQHVVFGPALRQRCEVDSVGPDPFLGSSSSRWSPRGKHQTNRPHMRNSVSRKNWLNEWLQPKTFVLLGRLEIACALLSLSPEICAMERFHCV